MPWPGSSGFSDVVSPTIARQLGQCMLSYSKLQEDTFHLVKLVEIIFHISYGVRRVASVLRLHTEVDERPDASENMFERYHL